LRFQSKTIFVQIEIRGSIDRIWELTQTPESHQKWDLRFTDIQYLPRPDPQQPQQFLYATRIGFGLAIRGGGETVGSRHDAGNGMIAQRISALKFWSEDRKSLIVEGSGYWKYIPLPTAPATVRFLTGYDYRVRFGLVGKIFDHFIFRPLMGWATAWSFDRLRLWIEEGIAPAESMRKAIVYGICRGTLAFVWIYQGLVPKILFHDGDEIAMLKGAGIVRVIPAANWIGACEIILGLILLFSWKSRWPLVLTAILMVIATAAVVAKSPVYLHAAFNPAVLNMLMIAIATIGLVNGRQLPSASRCLRSPPSEGK
jgi:hypothetical protein